MRRLAARALYRTRPACFACGALRSTPCPGHEYGGTITVSQRRRHTPWTLARFVDSRWSW